MKCNAVWKTASPRNSKDYTLRVYYKLWQLLPVTKTRFTEPTAKPIEKGKSNSKTKSQSIYSFPNLTISCSTWIANLDVCDCIFPLCRSINIISALFGFRFKFNHSPGSVFECVAGVTEEKDNFEVWVTEIIFRLPVIIWCAAYFVFYKNAFHSRITRNTCMP